MPSSTMTTPKMVTINFQSIETPASNVPSRCKTCSFQAARLRFDSPRGLARPGIEKPHGARLFGRIVDHQRALAVLDERAGEQAQPLLAAREPQVRPVGESADTEYFHPLAAGSQLLFRCMHEQSYSIEQPAGDDVQRGQVLEISPVHFRADVSYVFLYVPDAFSGTPSVTEQLDVAGIALRVVGADK